MLEELFYDHYRPALLYPLSLCRNLANAEDIVSQAFETALLAPEERIQSGCCRGAAIFGWTKYARPALPVILYLQFDPAGGRGGREFRW